MAHHQQQQGAQPLDAQMSLNGPDLDSSNTNTNANATLTTAATNLNVPGDARSANNSRPESPVNRKRADDDSVSGQGLLSEDGSLNYDGHHHHHSHSLPPSKKSKTSPPLAPTDDSSGRGSTYNIDDHHHQSHHQHPHPPYSNVVIGRHNLTDYRTSNEIADDALSPQTSPLLEPLMPCLPTNTATGTTALGTTVASTIATHAAGSEKRYSPVTDSPVQSNKARKLDDDIHNHGPSSPPFQATSPPFRARSPPFQAGSPPFRATSPSFSRNATAILDSLSKPGENSLGNLNLGTPIIGRTPVGERVMGVITTSQPNSRQSSPDPKPVPTATAGLGVGVGVAGADAIDPRKLGLAEGAAVAGVPALIGTDTDLNEAAAFSLDDIPETIPERDPREPSPAGAMRIFSDDEHQYEPYNDIHEDDEGPEEEEGENDEEEEDPVDALGEEPMHEVEDDEHGFDSDSDDEFGHDSMDEIDVEGIGMLDYDDSDSESVPYQDPDPMCLDRFTKEEADTIIDEARLHGIAFVVRKYILSGLASTKKMLLMTFPEKEKAGYWWILQIEISDNVTEGYLISIISDRIKKLLRRRKRLPHIDSLEHVVSLLKTSKRIMVLTGAGVSVSCGIPDFRSQDGIYSRLSEFELDDPQQMFDLDFFRERPQIFYSFAREIFPSNFIPSPSHYFIKLLEDQDKLLRNYTQNIDTLEQKAGIVKVLQCHGSFATASCVRCGHQVPGDEIKDQIFKQEVAYCKVCKTPSPPPHKKAKAKAKKRSGYHSSDEDDSDDDDDDDGNMNRALMKPDIVFFGEKLPDVFHTSLKEDREQVDLLIVIGSSLKVAPVSDIMHQLPHSVPQILINRTPNHQMEFDVQLLGNCDTVVAELCRMAGWELLHEKLPGGTSNVPDMATNSNMDGSGQGGRAAWSFVAPNTYLFEGADPEELNFQAIQEKNRKRARQHLAATGAVPSLAGAAGMTGGDHEDDEDEVDEDEDEEEGGEHEYDMEGLTTEASNRRLLPRDDRAGSTGLMDEDDPEEGEDDEDGSEQGSEQSQDTIRGVINPLPSTESTGTLQPPSTAASSSVPVPAPAPAPAAAATFLSPRLQPVGIAAGTIEPRTGSIHDIHNLPLSSPHHGDPSGIRSSLHAPSLLSPQQVPSGLSPEAAHGYLYEGGNLGVAPVAHAAGVTAEEDEDEDEEVKIRVMFTEKMPKDLGEEDDDEDEEDEGDNGLRGESLNRRRRSRSLSHSRRPSEDLQPIREDAQEEVEVEEVSDEDDNGHGNGAGLVKRTPL
ncbi:NAD-dependent histone deacetylase sir2 [Mortierella claussenii]|nr:NAD-dependent histone deacetylase sir2 [Mortierella claussenii]